MLGEEFGLVESRVLCKSHYLEIIEGNIIFKFKL